MLGLFDLLYIIVPTVVALAIIRHRRRRGEEVSREVAIGIYLFWFLIFAVGVAGIFDGLSQMFNGDETAELNEWPESPFVIELGMMNFTFGVLGLLCIKIKGTWWYAAGVGYALFLLMAAYYHVFDWVANGNNSDGNTGLALYSDILAAVLLIALCVLHARGATRRERAPSPP